MVCQNVKDLAALEPILGMSLLVLIVAGLINMVLKLALVHFLLTILGVFVFTMFLVFDLNRLYMTNDNHNSRGSNARCSWNLFEISIYSCICLNCMTKLQIVSKVTIKILL